MAARKAAAKPKPGFWDTYVDEGGGLYVTAEEKAALIENEVAFQILSIENDDDNTYQGNVMPRFLVTVSLANPLTGEDEERLFGFAKGVPATSRDRLLEALEAYLGEKGAEDVFVTLERVGQFIAIRKAA